MPGIEYDNTEEPQVSVVPSESTWEETRNYVSVAHRPTLAALPGDDGYAGLDWDNADGIRRYPLTSKDRQEAVAEFRRLLRLSDPLTISVALHQHPAGLHAEVYLRYQRSGVRMYRSVTDLNPGGFSSDALQFAEDAQAGRVSGEAPEGLLDAMATWTPLVGVNSAMTTGGSAYATDPEVRSYLGLPRVEGAG